MNRVAFLLVAALLAVVPAAIGLSGNASFSEEVPVRVPSGAELIDRDGHLLPAKSPALVARPTPGPETGPVGDDDSGQHRRSGGEDGHSSVSGDGDGSSGSRGPGGREDSSGPSDRHGSTGPGSGH